jgi:hypothetical protein
MELYEKYIFETLEQHKDIYLKKMEELTKHPLPYKEIVCYLTTLPRCPYHREK